MGWGIMGKISYWETVNTCTSDVDIENRDFNANAISEVLHGLLVMLFSAI